MPLAEAEGFLIHRWCVLGKPLCHQGKEGRRLYDARHDKKESDPSFSEILRAQEPECSSCTKGGAGKVCACWAGK